MPAARLARDEDLVLVGRGSVIEDMPHPLSAKVRADMVANVLGTIQEKVEAQQSQVANYQHAEQIALDYAVNAATIANANTRPRSRLQVFMDTSRR